ncbi:RtcB family protein [Ruminiclostridium cellobioparum]|uniref:RtcB family protein n=1 Tax=Ruminiclostridium cellobioparum TaxID=29355 RepID=UPI000486477A
MFAEFNRKAIAEVIVRKMGFEVKDSFTTIHNYIDMNEMILRKGAISAREGERVIIPVNMRDGSIIAVSSSSAIPYILPRLNGWVLPVRSLAEYPRLQMDE